MVVTERIAELVVFRFLALRDIAGDLHLGRWRDVVANPYLVAGIQDVAQDTVEVSGAEAVVVRRLGDIFACAAVVAGVGITGAVGGILALRPSEGRGAQTLGTLVAGDAGASIAAVEAAAGLGIILTCGAGKALNKRTINKKNTFSFG